MKIGLCLGLLLITVNGQAQTDTIPTITKIVSLYNQFAEQPKNPKIELSQITSENCQQNVLKVNAESFNKLPADEKINWIFEKLNRC